MLERFFLDLNQADLFLILDLFTSLEQIQATKLKGQAKPTGQGRIIGKDF